MTSIEARKDSVSSLHLQNSAESQKENSQLTNIQNGENLVDTNKVVTTDIKDNKDAQNITNSDQKKGKNEEMIIVENNKKVKCNMNKIEHRQNAEKLDAISSVSDNELKTNKNENVKETTSKSGANLKRTRRNISTQETDIALDESNSKNKRKKKNVNDKFCWRCHKESVEAHCSACPRSWHRKCIGMQQSIIQNWICGECAAILQAENAETRSTAMAQLSVDQLCLLLKHVVERMREYPGSEPFWKPVELSEAPNYLDYVVKPMDLSLLESNVQSKLYGSTDAFMADAKWIQHNCIVFNTCGGVYTDTSKLTNAAKQIIKLVRQEVSEIEACPDCYAHGRNLPRPHPAWFIEPCRHPHPLVWAKLKGFPFWPAKAMPRINSQGFIDVRFFGEHDRAWVSPRDLYLYSEEPPVPLPRKRKLDMEECVNEITRHCRKLELVFGKFKFAPPRVQYNPHDPMQIKLMLPNYDPLHSNNCTSSQHLTPKKTPFVKKRMHIKTNLQIDSEQVNNSDIGNKMSIKFNSINKGNKIENKSSKVEQEPDHFHETESVTITSNNLSKLIKKVVKEDVQPDKNLSANLEKEIKEDISKPSTSKTNTNNISDENSNAIKYDTKESNFAMLKQGNNFENATNNNTKSLENSSLQVVASSKKHVARDIHIPKQELPFKTNINKGGVGQKNNFKNNENTEKIYKPKTRIVDKMNAEKALKFSTTERSQNIINSIISMKQQNNSTTLKNGSKNDNSNLTASSISIMTNKTSVNADINGDIDIHRKNAADKSIVLPSVNDDMSNVKKSIEKTIEERKKSDTLVQVQQTSRDSSRTKDQEIKESKARKSFPNKTRNYPQLVPHSSTNISSSVEAIHRTENCIEYQMLPPEAGPISARLYHDAQNLTKKMAKLMEEAYKEAVQENRNCESHTVSENHQATVHFLKLQIERMRWQHQQQLAELKHNTDRILREMKASLEAERLRAVEETRREVEKEKLRCIEEIKRKQWCAMCGREALFYCCWNTAYCDYPCQQSHWPMHMRTCAQKPSFATIITSSSNSNQQQNHNIKINSLTNRTYELPHNKLNEISASLTLCFSETEGDGNSS
ncbi:protein kinase C-binding protein 1 [Frieseomelitta varia]|uniref:protein kinase C-binding protein 1 n=1 Tax=Frieseomelitta varia TaxID=561572 RepID=UPI001CB68957|nr:protein kinase C-binding protein 1 [Frieseomelitta varia]XP_043520109.1 protein kinase C-binding protein 1 [Frieseomelitta varia]XP_043520110.1 protein kinase C-binding protein 1 [Frieseomelitta varia]XP_043520111.1 protein kinase C-binding protein 1 [Frieseomelitta varia]XP_043520112.1 protein kinase C-binding protein 1 [Frieseomelitta varia]XP_043520113.1 protein kinase C-binding protein 1 [Frieseomelitta varia]XP_043520114.1 protein kinase C-binding protein 1 [Frieseomelitta varia]